ncbi:MAG TPA: GAF domain-containing protein [Solirubrobacteraceae bacterium]|nr:GAF domain-containing protein [Solirubrobacteraceae bacterium]
MNRTPALFAGVEPLEVFVELLADLDADTTSTEFYDRICEAICRLTTMQRAAIFMSQGRGYAVRAIGAHGTSFAELASFRPTLWGTPIARKALLADEVTVVRNASKEAMVPVEYADQLGISTLVCTPLSAAGRAYGVICADRGGGEFELSDGERHLLWTLGKTAALVATARITTREEEQARRLTERLDLAREIHERVIQRLFGVSLALTSDSLDDAQRERSRAELQEAMGELRAALERPLAIRPTDERGSLAAELERLADVGTLAGAELSVEWAEGVEVPTAHEQAAQSFLTEALRNAKKHARPRHITVSVSNDGETFALQVRNDGVEAGPRGAGMGLRLAAFEALQLGGVVEFGTCEGSGWRARLVLPV